MSAIIKKITTPVIPAGFEIVQVYTPARTTLATTRNVQAFHLKGRTKTRIRFGASTLAQAKLDPAKPVTLAQLGNGMWAIIQTAAGGVKLSSLDEGNCHSAAFNIPLHFANEAELFNGMWCFPPSTWKKESLQVARSEQEEQGE